MTIEAMKNIGTRPSGFAGAAGPLAARRCLREAALDLRQRERREQQHHARDHERQPRVLVAQHDAEIGRYRAGQP